MPFSSTLPRGDRSAEPGATARPTGSRSASSPPVPWSRSIGGRPGSVPGSKRCTKDSDVSVMADLLGQPIAGSAASISLRCRSRNRGSFSA